jgi:hypothetical protein
MAENDDRLIGNGRQEEYPSWRAGETVQQIVDAVRNGGMEIRLEQSEGDFGSTALTDQIG